jgi:hypothetical protein
MNLKVLFPEWRGFDCMSNAVVLQALVCNSTIRTCSRCLRPRSGHPFLDLHPELQVDRYAPRQREDSKKK